MLFELALIPAVILLIYIYKKDTVEKEPTLRHSPNPHGH